MNKRKTNLKPLLGIGLLGVLAVAVIGGINLYKRPLGASLDSANRAPSEGVALTDPTATLPATIAAAAVPNPTQTPAGVCGETAVWNVLVLGSDASDLYYPQGSDLTRVVRVDFLNRRVASFAFSRDLWVNTGSLSFANPNLEASMLGMVYYEAQHRSKASDPDAAILEATNAIAKMLQENFTLTSDHYITLDLDQLPTMIDTIGGLPINIPADMTDPLSGMAFKAGQQTLDGNQAAIYARAYVDNDLNRIQRNNLVVEALRQKLLDPVVWVKIPQLFLQFKDAVITDFSPEQVNHMACLMKELTGDDITQDEVKAEWTSPGPQGSLLWDREKVLGKLKELGMIP